MKKLILVVALFAGCSNPMYTNNSGTVVVTNNSEELCWASDIIEGDTVDYFSVRNRLAHGESVTIETSYGKVGIEYGELRDSSYILEMPWRDTVYIDPRRAQ